LQDLNLGRLVWLALLDASRLEEKGDMAAAWGRYRAILLLFRWLWPSIRISERREHRALTVILAEELYHRERGTLPPSEKALVGIYLDHLPSDGSDELDDGTAQWVED
jgi:hypothetical protein